MSSDQEVGGEDRSEIAAVQTHQRQPGRLEASTAPASDWTAAAFRPIGSIRWRRLHRSFAVTLVVMLHF